MDGNSWRQAAPAPAPPDTAGAAAGADPAGGDWRQQLMPEARQRIVNKIMDTLKRHLPISVPEGLSELKKIAVRFEEKIYTAATNQSDYLRKISLKMLSMETKTQGTAAINPSLSNPVVGNQSPSESVSTMNMPPQVGNQGQSLAIPMVNPSQVRQPVLPPSLQNNNVSAALQGSAGISSAMPPIAGLNQSSLANAVQNSNLQNMSGLSQNTLNNSAGQGIAQNLYANQQRQIQSRQPQQQSQNQLHYQQQLLQQQQLLKQKVHQSSLLQPHMQHQQQQSLLQPNQLQSSQQPMMQMAANLQPGHSGIQQTQPGMMQSAPQPNLQQNQQNIMQQAMPSLLQHPQSIARQQGQPSMHQQSSSLQQQSTPISQQMVMSSQQQQLMGHPSNMQQPQLLGQQNSATDMQPQQQQQQRLSGQQNSLSMQQSQQLLNQQTALHQQQLGSHNGMSGLQQQQLHQQQQQLLGSQSSGMHSQQRPMHNLQQPKTVAQQQHQQSMSSLQSQGQLSQNQAPQQQLMPQIQAQGPQLQQQLTMQQNSIQREMQQRLQASGSMLQSQNTIEQKPVIQSQRGVQEVSSSTSMDSTTQTGHGGMGDWQEEIYQKVKSMKELYLGEINELHQKIGLKIQQTEALGPPAKQSDQFEKLKQFKQMLERTILFLNLNKNSIQSNLKDKLPLYEKQIMSFVASNRSKKPPSQQQEQPQFAHPSGQAHSIPQQQQSQVAQLQQHDNHLSQSQQMNLQGSVTSMQNSSSSSMQQRSVPLSSHVTVPATQQNLANAVQPASLDPMQGSSFSSMQQGAMGSMQLGGIGSLQNTISAPQQSSNALQQQQLKQHQQEQQQQLKQMQQLQMQQLQMQQQKQQMLQQSPLQQQLHQQKPLQTSQVPVRQLPQIYQMNDGRQGSGMKPGIYQQHYPGPGPQRHNYYQQLKPGASFPISSPQNTQASSPQISQSSPQIDQHNLLITHPKAGTPLQSANSPFVVPSPSPSTPVAPSPLPGDTEKQSGIPSLTNPASAGYQQQTTLAASQSQTPGVGTPGISASPLLAEFTSPDGSQANALTALPSKSSTAEDPVARLLKVIRSMSPKALSSAVSDIRSVVSMTDRIAGSAPGNGSRAAVGEDLVAMTKCRLQARNFISQDGNTATKKMKRHTTAMPLNVVSSAGSFNDSFKQSYSLDTSELESTATSSVKRQKINHPLFEEIREINQRLIDTVVSISEEDTDSVVAYSSCGEGTVVKFSFSAVSIGPSLKSLFTSAQKSPIMPLRLLVPDEYPKCSPTIIDKLPVEASKEDEDLLLKAQSTFSRSLRCLSEPMSLGEMAKTWDASVRKVILEFAQQHGGGTFTSRYGAWENCVGA